MDEFDEIVREFLVESYENLDQLDRDLVALEQEPDAHPLLQSIFRTIHTIKGTSGFLAFGKLEVLTHAGEGLLARLRDGGLRLTQERTTGLLELVDAVRGILAAIEATGIEDDRDYTDLVARLTALQTPLPETELATAGATAADAASAATRGGPARARSQAAASSTPASSTPASSTSASSTSASNTPASSGPASATAPGADAPKAAKSTPRPRRRSTDAEPTALPSGAAATSGATARPRRRSTDVQPTEQPPAHRAGCQARHQSGACRTQGEHGRPRRPREAARERPAAR